jgi:hypothetical protein
MVSLVFNFDMWIEMAKRKMEQENLNNFIYIENDFKNIKKERKKKRTDDCMETL